MLLKAWNTALLLLTVSFSVRAEGDIEADHDGYQLVRVDDMEFAMVNESTSISAPLLDHLFNNPVEKRQRFQCNNPAWVQCPNIPGRCKPPAASCCETGFYYYPGTTQCCPGGGTCSSSLKCCPKSCCLQNGYCGGDGYCSTLTWSSFTRTSTGTRTSTSTSTITSQETLTRTSTSTSYSTSYSTSTSTTIRTTCTPRPSANERRTWFDRLTNVFQDDKNQLLKRQRPFPTTCTTVCHASGQELPVVQFRPVPGETDELVKSMCAGMDGLYKRQRSGIEGGDPIWTNPVNGEDVLTYGGPAKSNPDAAARRKDIKCRKFRDEVCKGEAAKRGIAMECDEYPPAMSFEGGGLATRMCVPAKQNSKTQGPQLSRFIQACGLKKNDKFLLRIQGGCSKFTVPGPLMARDTQAQALDISDADATLRNPNGDGSLTYVAVGLGDLQVGHYDIEARFNGTVREAVVLNQYGDEYAVINSPSESARMSFDVADDYYQPAVLVAYTEHPVQVSYNGSVRPSNATQPPTPTGTTSMGKELEGSMIAILLSYALILGLVL